MSTPLCTLPPEPPPSCCAAPAPPPAAPVAVYNAPGLAAIRYRIGTFTSFRRAMLDKVLALSPNPFAQWREGAYGDYHTAFIELWAYLADILTFYQERVANEAYLGTATQRESLRRLTELIDYKPAPGSGASALLAFIAQKGKSVAVPSGLRAGNKPAAGKQQAVFETEQAITARSELSQIPVSPVAPTNQFAALENYQSPPASQVAQFGLFAASLYGSLSVLYLSTLQPTFFFGTALLSYYDAIGAFSRATALLSRTGMRAVVLKGTSNRLATGDYVLVTSNEGSSNEASNLFQLTSAVTDKDKDTTTVTWQEPQTVSYPADDSVINVYALRIKATPLGSDAQPYATLPDTTKEIYTGNWDNAADAAAYMPAGGTVFLDGVYEVKATAQSPNWVALVAESVALEQIFPVRDARPVSRTDYGTTTKVTQLSLASGSVPNQSGTRFPLRTTLILTGAERLTLQNNLPLPDPLAGATVIVTGAISGLAAGQRVIVQGTIYDPVARATTAVQSAEAAVLASAGAVDSANNLTVLTLKAPLARQYGRTSAVVFANVVEATQGETVKDETLGSGSGAPLQQFALKKSPLTYLPSTDPEGLAAVASTLRVTVNGVAWKERPTLVASAPDAQEYTTSQDDAGVTLVTFGDGVNGARPPTGAGNIHARYRKGLGSSGNVAAGAVAQMLDNVAGVQRVTNPLPTGGGVDPESIERIRENAPNSVRTFERAVSAPDYAALALRFPGIAKATANWVVREENLQAVAQPYIRLTVATEGQAPLDAAKLRAFLNARRDPNVPLRIAEFKPVYIDVVVTVDIDDRFPQQGTLNAVQAALSPMANADGSLGFFAFDRLQFGESIHLSALYAAIQAVPGVTDSQVNVLRRTGDTATTVADHIFVRPTEIAVIANDPADPSRGSLKVNLGQGGYLDT